MAITVEANRIALERKMPLSKLEITVWQRWYKGRSMFYIMEMQGRNSAPFYLVKKGARHG